MSTALKLFNDLWDALYTVPLFDLGFTFGHFITGLLLFDVTIIIVGRIVHKKSEDSK